MFMQVSKTLIITIDATKIILDYKYFSLLQTSSVVNYQSIVFELLLQTDFQADNGYVNTPTLKIGLPKY
jgi:hypothetical protein